MFCERFYFFTHGLCTMFFLLSGIWFRMMPNATRLNRAVSWILLLWGALELKDLAFYDDAIFRGNYLSNLLILIDMLAIPSGCFLVIELLDSGWLSWRRTLLFTSPVLLSVASYAITAWEGIVWITYLGMILYSAAFLLYSRQLVKRYNRMLIENFSNVEYIHLRWLNGVVLFLIFTLAAWIYSCLYSSWVVDTIYQWLLILLWGVILYYSGRQRSVPLTPEPEETPIPNQEDPSFYDFRRELERLMLQERVWMNPQITLQELATQAGTNRTYLSNYLNNSLQLSFYDYINNHRIEYATRLLCDPQNRMTMNEIAEQSGFNSISTFRHVFQRKHGCTFAEFRTRQTR